MTSVTRAVSTHPQLQVSPGRKIAWRLLTHPEAGAAGGAVVVYCFFALTAGDTGFLTFEGTGNWVSSASQLGIGALGIGLLLIAGEFDLSIGSILGACSMCLAICLGHYELGFGAAVLITVALGAMVGAINGFLVLKTGLPSFLVTLATLFIVAGASLGLSRYLTGVTTISLHVEGLPQRMFASDWNFFSISILWWIAMAGICHVVLKHSVIGNWIFATGGDVIQARAAGVRTGFVKVSLFVFVGICAALVMTTPM